MVAHFRHELLDFADGLQCGESWEIFHSNSIGSKPIVSEVLYCGESLNHTNCCSQAEEKLGPDSPFQDNTESENT